MNDYLRELNPKQREAVLCTEGPLLVVAGAGTGKTKTLTHRILHLMQRGVDPASILAITFTNKAAGEMRERILSSFNADPHEPIPWIGTFHGFGVFLLRNHAREAGTVRDFSILDQSDTTALVRDAMRAVGMSTEDHEPRKIRATISREKGNLVSPEEFRDTGTVRRAFSARLVLLIPALAIFLFALFIFEESVTLVPAIGTLVTGSTAGTLPTSVV